MPNKHVNVFYVPGNLWGASANISFALRVRKDTVIPICFTGGSWGFETLGHMPRAVTERPKMGIWSSDSSTSLSLLGGDHIGDGKLTAKCSF